jgi:N-acetyl-gamma-glutamyl-phosphate/LysW-gamma-L-alpha-aminoadipyl-6-phosphate reductase
MSRYKVAVLGASGFAGGELLRRLLLHPRVEVVRVCAKDHVGELVSSAHPHLEGRSELRFEDLAPADAVRGADVVMMGLPARASVEVVEATHDRDVRLIDMSGAFRLRRSEDYQRYYGEAHPRPELLAEFVYGLPELNREQIQGAHKVACPGCFATAVELGLLPFAAAGLLEGEVEAVGITGSSGSGVVPSATTHHPVRSNNLRTYRPLEHQHAPEIMDALGQALGRPVGLHFVPVSAPLVRGIFATSFFRVASAASEGELRAALEAYYAASRFVRVPRGRLPEVVAVSGSNYAEVGLALGPIDGDTRLVTAFSALDNLIKGGAGQAVQNLNLMLGLDEALTLEDPGPYP